MGSRAEPQITHHPIDKLAVLKFALSLDQHSPCFNVWNLASMAVPQRFGCEGLRNDRKQDSIVSTPARAAPETHLCIDERMNLAGQPAS